MRISDWSSDVCSSDLLAVELGVAEEAGTGAVLTVLRGFALAVEVLVTHPAGAAGDVEGDHDPVADGDLGDLDRKSVVEGKSVSVRVDLGGRRIIKKKKKNTTRK